MNVSDDLSRTQVPLKPVVPCDAVDSPAAPVPLDQATAGSALGRFFIYGLSIPERTVRSTVCLAAGAATEAAQFLVPQAFQSSRTYELVVKNSLDFLTRDVGGVDVPEDGEKTPDDFLARKAIGNFVDMAGLATLHVSPLWFMAILSDVAYGSKVYVLELAVELQKQGLIDDASTIHHVEDVLEAVRKTADEAAGLFDKPPLSVEQLKEVLDSTKRSVQSADYTRVLPEAELTQYWKEMRAISQQENVSLLGVSGALTMHTLSKVSTVQSTALTGVRVVGGLFSRHVVGHYVGSLEAVRNKGFYETVRESSGPYVGAVWNNFSANRETWTEQLVSGKLFRRAAGAVGGWLGRGAPEREESAK